MDEVSLRPITLAELSGLRHEIAVAERPSGRPPEFLVIRYSGEYRSGSAGRGDALYIVATAAAARKAWWSRSTVLDFQDLEYHWGDEMEWVTSIVWDPVTCFHEPLSVVVGERCRDALRSLLREGYARFCVETLEQAFALCRQQEQVYDQRLMEFRDRTERGAAADRPRG
ncbi:MAG: hypothetical protein E6K70_25890 [Planctomycetota bacterium]|nr:MAG: hypothetical protein E6K70_25890 [Planctomycetota bacterium]